MQGIQKFDGIKDDKNTLTKKITQRKTKCSQRYQ